MGSCRGCGGTRVVTVLNLGMVPAADYFPLASEPLAENEASHKLSMAYCLDCALAQLADDDTVTQEPRAVEPQALRDQAADAIARADRDGWLVGKTLREFGSPHGGTWIPLLAERGFESKSSDIPCDVVIDAFGIMHEPDQCAAFQQRAAATASSGVLLLQYHSLASILDQGQWNALRHGHFAYYSMHSMSRLLEAAGMSPAAAWQFDLYGGTTLVAAVHGRREDGPSVVRVKEVESAAGVDNPTKIRRLQGAVDEQVQSLRDWLEEESAVGHSVYGYGAASRAVSLFSRAGIDRTLLRGVADASVAKQGRRMPATDIPIISPAELLAADPDRVFLTLPDLLPEVSREFPALRGRWNILTSADDVG